MTSHITSMLACLVVGLFISTSFTCGILHFPNARLHHQGFIDAILGDRKTLLTQDLSQPILSVEGRDGEILLQKDGQQPKILVVCHYRPGQYAFARVLASDRQVSLPIQGNHHDYRVYNFGAPPENHGLPEDPNELARQIHLDFADGQVSYSFEP